MCECNVEAVAHQVGRSYIASTNQCVGPHAQWPRTLGPAKERDGKASFPAEQVEAQTEARNKKGHRRMAFISNTSWSWVYQSHQPRTRKRLTLLGFSVGPACGVVFGGDAGLGQGVEKGGLAHVAALEAHGGAFGFGRKPAILRGGRFRSSSPRPPPAPRATPARRPRARWRSCRR